MSKPAKHLKKSKAQTFTWNVIAVASNDPQKRKNLKVSFIAILKPSFNYQVQMKWFFLLLNLKEQRKVKKIAVYRVLIFFLVPVL